MVAVVARSYVRGKSGIEIKTVKKKDGKKNTMRSEGEKVVRS